MGSCYSYNTDIIPCNTEEPQQKYNIGTVSDRLLVGGGRARAEVIIFYWVQNFALCFSSGLKYLVRMKVS